MICQENLSVLCLRETLQKHCFISQQINIAVDLQPHTHGIYIGNYLQVFS